MTPLIEFRNVTKIFGGGVFAKKQTIALENFSMSLADAPPLITAGQTCLRRSLSAASSCWRRLPAK